MMKRLKIAVLAFVLTGLVIAPAFARQPVKPAVAVPRISSVVLDASGALDAAQLKDLKVVIGANEMRTGVQMIVVIAPTLGGDTTSAFLAEAKQKTNFSKLAKPAVLFVVAVKEKAAAIAANANTPITAGAQDAIIQRIVLPNFRLGKIDTGIYDGARAITLALQVPAITKAAQVEQDGDAFWKRWIPLIVLGVLLVGFGNSDWNRGTTYDGGGYTGRSRRY